MSINDNEFYFVIKSSIVSEGIFERFPLLIPKAGKHYWREDGRHCKMLLVGANNYFDKPEDKKESVFSNSELWYTGKDVKLIPSYRENDVNNFKGNTCFDKAFVLANNILKEDIDFSNSMREFAFYNYYLRPAEGTDVQHDYFDRNDKIVAGEALTGIINKLAPDIVIFLIKRAYNDFGWYRIDYLKNETIAFNGVHIDVVACPSSQWWNRDGGKHGRAKFENLLREHWIK